ncbi:MAG: trypsin-like peptidase domain-containing protein [Acidobacteria bacterium]|nr:trypsin-like peptidase domain-containing protein [Acidobacteriota bacterium]
MKLIFRSRKFSAATFLLCCIISVPLRADDKQKDQTAQVPEELRGAKVYKLPEDSKDGSPAESPVIYRKLAYKDLNLQRLVLNMWVSVKPFDKSVTVSRIFFQDVQANGIPVRVEPYATEFKTSKKDPADLPAPLQCTITFSDLESVVPIKEMIDREKITITGQSFIEVKLNTLQKIAVRAKRLVLPVPLKEEMPLEMFSGSPMLRIAASGILATLADPKSAAAIALAKEHLARMAGARTLEQKGSESLYLVYTEYALRDPKSGASEKFSQSGTGFLLTVDGQLATAKRVIEPWKFDPQTVLMVTRDHLELDPNSVRHAAWPAGATILGGDGMPDLATGSNTDKQTLQVLKTPPDTFEKREYQEPDSTEKVTLDLHTGGKNDLALLKLSGDKFQPLPLAPDLPVAAGAKLSLLGFPFGLSQPKATPKPEEVEVAKVQGSITLSHTLSPGQSGAPLVTPEGKVVALCSEPALCISASFLAKLAP